jgi:hypothetical protein
MGVRHVGAQSEKMEGEGEERLAYRMIFPGACCLKYDNDHETTPQAWSPVVAPPSKNGRTLPSTKSTAAKTSGAPPWIWKP